MFTPPAQPASRRRQAGAALLALLLPMTLGLSAVLATSQLVVALPDEAPIEVVFAEEPQPPLPAPAAGGATPAEATAAEEPPEPPPEVLEPEEPEPENPQVVELTEDIPPPAGPATTSLAAAIADLSLGSGRGTGDGIGDGEGACVGPDCGACVGPDCGGCVGPHCGQVREISWTEIAVRRQVDPRMPEAARALPPGEYPCQLRFFVDERGKPAEVRIEACPAAFQDSALRAAQAWRFEPMKVEGQPVPAQFTLKVRYQVR